MCFFSLFIWFWSVKNGSQCCVWDRGCYFQVGDSLKLGMSIPIAFRTALDTWASWVETMIDKDRTLVFFRTFEPSHWRYFLVTFGLNLIQIQTTLPSDVLIPHYFLLYLQTLLTVNLKVWSKCKPSSAAKHVQDYFNFLSFLNLYSLYIIACVLYQ